MPSLPPLDCLRFFEAAARRESFAKAAEELLVTPSAVAHRVKILERHLGAALFARVHRGVDPARRDFDIWLAYVGKTAAPDLSRASGFRLYKVVSQYIVACGVNHSGNRLRRKLTEMLYQASLNLHSASDPTRAT